MGRPAGGRIGAPAAFGVVMGRRSAGCTRGYAGGGTGRCAGRRAAWPSRGSPAGSWGRRRVSSGPATPHLLRCLTPATQRFKYLHLSASQTMQVTRGISRGALSWLLVCMGMALPLPGDTQTQSQPDPSPTPLSPFWDPPLPCPHPQGLFLLCKKVISAVANVSFLFDSHTA